MWDELRLLFSAAEVKVLFKIMRELEAEFPLYIFPIVSEEIMEIGDHVTILRDGKYVADAELKDIELSWIVREYG